MICMLIFKKDVLILKCYFGFFAFVFEATPHPICYLTSIVDKTHHWLVIATFFICSFCGFFSYVGGVLVTKPFFTVIHWYILAIQQTKSICDNLFDLQRSSELLRSVGTIVITTESRKNSLKAIFTKQSLKKATIFSCFDVYPVRSPHIFQIQVKISTIRPVFPDYSVSYDYAGKN